MRILPLAVACYLTPALADDYTDVAQMMRSGKLAEAMVKADQYLSSKPRDPQMRFLKGVMQKDSGNPQEAIGTFTKLTEDYPELPEPYNNLAVLYASQHQYDKARAALEMAIRTNPSYATAHENLGDVYAKLASQAYNKALQLDAGNAAVPPKLALIRELFNPTAKGQRPGAASTPAAQPTATSAKPVATTPLVASTKPALVTGAGAPSASGTVSTNEVADSAQKSVEAAVQSWAKAWATKNMTAYLSAYDRSFDPSGGQSRKAWEEERNKRITSKRRISVRIESLSVQVNGERATAKFRQDYRADALSVSSRKTLELARSGERWLIVRESTGS